MVSSVVAFNHAGAVALTNDIVLVAIIKNMNTVIIFRAFIFITSIFFLVFYFSFLFYLNIFIQLFFFKIKNNCSVILIN